MSHRREVFLKLEKIFKFIELSNRRRGYPPTLEEISKKFFVSVGTAFNYVRMLKQLKVLRDRAGKKKQLARGIKVISG